MTKITLSHLSNLQNEATAVNTLNANSDTIVSSFDNILSRDGTAPNQMMSGLDMNNNQILNLPSPASSTSPARLQDVTTSPIISSVPPVGTSGAVVGLLNGNNIVSGNNTYTGSNKFTGGSSTTVTPGTNSGNFLSSAISPSVSVPGRVDTSTEYAQNLVQWNSNQDFTIGEVGLSVNGLSSTGRTTSAPIATDYKVGIFNQLLATTNSGHTWGQANDLQVNSGTTGINRFYVNTEFDCTNNGQDYAPGGPNGNFFNLFVSGNTGAFPITAEIMVGPLLGDSSHYAAHYGLAFEGSYTIKDATIVDNTNSTVSYIDTGTHSNGIILAGIYSSSAIDLPLGTVTITQGTLPSLKLVGNASAANCIQVTNQPATLSPFISSVGSDTDIDLGLVAKGVGQIVLGSAIHVNAAGSFTANGSVAKSMTSVGPTGSHTTVQEWLTFTNVAGVTRYVPCF